MSNAVSNEILLRWLESAQCLNPEIPEYSLFLDALGLNENSALVDSSTTDQRHLPSGNLLFDCSHPLTRELSAQASPLMKNENSHSVCTSNDPSVQLSASHMFESAEENVFETNNETPFVFGVEQTSCSSKSFPPYQALNESEAFAAALDEVFTPLSPLSIFSSATISHPVEDDVTDKIRSLSNKPGSDNIVPQQGLLPSQSRLQLSCEQKGQRDNLQSRRLHCPPRSLCDRKLDCAIAESMEASADFKRSATDFPENLESALFSSSGGNLTRVISETEALSVASACSATNECLRANELNCPAGSTSTVNLIPQFLRPPAERFDNCPKSKNQTGYMALVRSPSSSPTQVGRAKPHKIVRPSRFCHVCGRKGAEGVGKLAMCGRIQKAECRKVICEVCLGKHGWGRAVLRTNGAEKPVSDIDSSWLCPHCTNSCGENAQCATYRRTNHKRHLMLREKRKAIMRQTDGTLPQS